MTQLMFDLEALRGPSRLPEFVSQRRKIARMLWYQGWTYRKIGALLNRSHDSVRGYINQEGWQVNGSRHKSVYGQGAE